MLCRKGASFGRIRYVPDPEGRHERGEEGDDDDPQVVVDRVHRIGQKNNVTYIDLVTENTVEEKVLKALRNKINIASEVLSEGYKEWLI